MERKDQTPLIFRFQSGNYLDVPTNSSLNLGLYDRKQPTFFDAVLDCKQSKWQQDISPVGDMIALLLFDRLKLTYLQGGSNHHSNKLELSAELSEELHVDTVKRMMKWSLTSQYLLVLDGLGKNLFIYTNSLVLLTRIELPREHSSGTIVGLFPIKSVSNDPSITTGKQKTLIQKPGRDITEQWVMIFTNSAMLSMELKIPSNSQQNPQAHFHSHGPLLSQRNVEKANYCLSNHSLYLVSSAEKAQVTWSNERNASATLTLLRQSGNNFNSDPNHLPPLTKNEWKVTTECSIARGYFAISAPEGDTGTAHHQNDWMERMNHQLASWTSDLITNIAAIGSGNKFVAPKFIQYSIVDIAAGHQWIAVLHEDGYLTLLRRNDTKKTLEVVLDRWKAGIAQVLRSIQFIGEDVLLTINSEGQFAAFAISIQSTNPPHTVCCLTPYPAMNFPPALGKTDCLMSTLSGQQTICSVLRLIDDSTLHPFAMITITPETAIEQHLVEGLLPEALKIAKEMTRLSDVEVYQLCWRLFAQSFSSSAATSNSIRTHYSPVQLLSAILESDVDFVLCALLVFESHDLEEMLTILALALQKVQPLFNQPNDKREEYVTLAYLLSCKRFKYVYVSKLVEELYDQTETRQRKDFDALLAKSTIAGEFTSASVQLLTEQQEAFQSNQAGNKEQKKVMILQRICEEIASYATKRSEGRQGTIYRSRITEVDTKSKRSSEEVADENDEEISNWKDKISLPWMMWLKFAAKHCLVQPLDFIYHQFVQHHLSSSMEYWLLVLSSFPASADPQVYFSLMTFLSDKALLNPVNIANQTHDRDTNENNETESMMLRCPPEDLTTCMTSILHGSHEEIGLLRDCYAAYCCWQSGSNSFAHYFLPISPSPTQRSTLTTSSSPRYFHLINWCLKRILSMEQCCQSFYALTFAQQCLVLIPHDDVPIECQSISLFFRELTLQFAHYCRLLTKNALQFEVNFIKWCSMSAQEKVRLSISHLLTQFNESNVSSTSDSFIRFIAHDLKQLFSGEKALYQVMSNTQYHNYLNILSSSKTAKYCAVECNKDETESVVVDDDYESFVVAALLANMTPMNRPVLQVIHDIVECSMQTATSTTVDLSRCLTSEQVIMRLVIEGFVCYDDLESGLALMYATIERIFSTLPNQFLHVLDTTNNIQHASTTSNASMDACILMLYEIESIVTIASTLKVYFPIPAISLLATEFVIGYHAKYKLAGFETNHNGLRMKKYYYQHQYLLAKEVHPLVEWIEELHCYTQNLQASLFFSDELTEEETEFIAQRSVAELLSAMTFGQSLVLKITHVFITTHTTKSNPNIDSIAHWTQYLQDIDAIASSTLFIEEISSNWLQACIVTAIVQYSSLSLLHELFTLLTGKHKGYLPKAMVTYKTVILEQLGVQVELVWQAIWKWKIHSPVASAILTMSYLDTATNNQYGEVVLFENEEALGIIRRFAEELWVMLSANETNTVMEGQLISLLQHSYALLLLALFVYQHSHEAIIRSSIFQQLFDASNSLPLINSPPKANSKKTHANLMTWLLQRDARYYVFVSQYTFPKSLQFISSSISSLEELLAFETKGQQKLDESFTSLEDENTSTTTFPGHLFVELLLAWQKKPCKNSLKTWEHVHELFTHAIQRDDDKIHDDLMLFIQYLTSKLALQQFWSVNKEKKLQEIKQKLLQSVLVAVALVGDRMIVSPDGTEGEEPTLVWIKDHVLGALLQYGDEEVLDQLLTNNRNDHDCLDAKKIGNSTEVINTYLTQLAAFAMKDDQESIHLSSLTFFTVTIANLLPNNPTITTQVKAQVSQTLAEYYAKLTEINQNLGIFPADNMLFNFSTIPATNAQQQLSTNSPHSIGVLNVDDPKVNLMLSQLIQRGFSLSGAKRCIYFTRKNNNTLGTFEDALRYAIEHNQDADFDHPLVVGGGLLAGDKEKTGAAAGGGKIASSSRSMQLKKRENLIKSMKVFEDVFHLATQGKETFQYKRKNTIVAKVTIPASNNIPNPVKEATQEVVKESPPVLIINTLQESPIASVTPQSGRSVKPKSGGKRIVISATKLPTDSQDFSFDQDSQQANGHVDEKKDDILPIVSPNMAISPLSLAALEPSATSVFQMLPDEQVVMSKAIVQQTKELNFVPSVAVGDVLNLHDVAKEVEVVVEEIAPSSTNEANQIINQIIPLQQTIIHEEKKYTVMEAEPIGQTKTTEAEEEEEKTLQEPEKSASHDAAIDNNKSTEALVVDSESILQQPMLQLEGTVVQATTEEVEPIAWDDSIVLSTTSASSPRSSCSTLINQTSDVQIIAIEEAIEVKGEEEEREIEVIKEKEEDSSWDLEFDMEDNETNNSVADNVKPLVGETEEEEELPETLALTILETTFREHLTRMSEYLDMQLNATMILNSLRTIIMFTLYPQEEANDDADNEEGLEIFVFACQQIAMQEETRYFQHLMEEILPCLPSLPGVTEAFCKRLYSAEDMQTIAFEAFTLDSVTQASDAISWIMQWYRFRQFVLNLNTSLQHQVTSELLEGLYRHVVWIVRGLNQLYLDIPPTSSALRMIIIVKNHLVTLLESTVVLSSPMQMNSLKDYLIDQGLLPSPVTATTEVIIEQIEQSLSEDITVLKRLERIAETSHIDRIKTVVLSETLILKRYFTGLYAGSGAEDEEYLLAKGQAIDYLSPVLTKENILPYHRALGKLLRLSATELGLYFILHQLQVKGGDHAVAEVLSVLQLTDKLCKDMRFMELLGYEVVELFTLSDEQIANDSLWQRLHLYTISTHATSMVIKTVCSSISEDMFYLPIQATSIQTLSNQEKQSLLQSIVTLLQSYNTTSPSMPLSSANTSKKQRGKHSEEDALIVSKLLTLYDQLFLSYILLLDSLPSSLAATIHHTVVKHFTQPQLIPTLLPILLSIPQAKQLSSWHAFLSRHQTVYLPTDNVNATEQQCLEIITNLWTKEFALLCTEKNQHNVYKNMLTMIENVHHFFRAHEKHHNEGSTDWFSTWLTSCVIPSLVSVTSQPLVLTNSSSITDLELIFSSSTNDNNIHSTIVLVVALLTHLKQGYSQEVQGECDEAIYAVLSHSLIRQLYILLHPARREEAQSDEWKAMNVEQVVEKVLQIISTSQGLLSTAQVSNMSHSLCWLLRLSHCYALSNHCDVLQDWFAPAWSAHLVRYFNATNHSNTFTMSSQLSPWMALIELLITHHQYHLLVTVLYLDLVAVVGFHADQYVSTLRHTLTTVMSRIPTTWDNGIADIPDEERIAWQLLYALGQVLSTPASPPFDSLLAITSSLDTETLGFFLFVAYSFLPNHSLSLALHFQSQPLSLQHLVHFLCSLSQRTHPRTATTFTKHTNSHTLALSSVLSPLLCPNHLFTLLHLCQPILLSTVITTVPVAAEEQDWIAERIFTGAESNGVMVDGIVLGFCAAMVVQEGQLLMAGALYWQYRALPKQFFTLKAAVAQLQRGFAQYVASLPSNADPSPDQSLTQLITAAKHKLEDMTTAPR